MRDAVGNIASILVLGGGSEIAVETIKALTKRRLRRVVLAVRSPDKVADVVDDLRSRGLEVAAIPFDGADIASHDRVIASAFDDGDFDVVLSAFGQLGDQDELDDDPTAAGELAVVNYAGQVSALTAVAKQLKIQGHGTIVVLSSVAGERVRKDNATYGSTKAGLDGFAQGLGDRLRGTGVGVMIVRPGFVHTRMTEGMDPAPLSTTPDAVAADIVSGLDRGATVIWSPAALRYLFSVLRHLPRPLWRIVSNR